MLVIKGEHDVKVYILKLLLAGCRNIKVARTALVNLQFIIFSTGTWIIAQIL